MGAEHYKDRQKTPGLDMKAPKTLESQLGSGLIGRRCP